MRVHVLQHEAFEGLGSMEAWFLTHGHEISLTALHRGAALPQRESFDWLVILGGRRDARVG